MLPHYVRYAGAVADVAAISESLSDFTAGLSKDRRLIDLRVRARGELQGLYEKIRTQLEMPSIPIYLPVRKKIMVSGVAHTLGGDPHDIRVYPIHGPTTKSFSEWEPGDILVDTAECVLETVVHECAHIREAHQYGIMTHELPFVVSYLEIEDVLIAAEIYQAVGLPNRFSGCPAGSFASTQLRHPREEGDFARFALLMLGLRI